MEIVACNIGAVTPMRIRLDVIGLDVITWMINSSQGQSLEIIMGVGYWKAHGFGLKSVYGDLRFFLLLGNQSADQQVVDAKQLLLSGGEWVASRQLNWTSGGRGATAGCCSRTRLCTGIALLIDRAWELMVSQLIRLLMLICFCFQEKGLGIWNQAKLVVRREDYEGVDQLLSEHVN